MVTTRWSADLRHPVFATRMLCEVAAERGISTRDVLTGTAIGSDDLLDGQAVVTAGDEIVAVRRMLNRLDDDAGLGMDVGSRLTLTHLGLMGFAAMSCATLRELVSVAMRYFSLTMLNIEVRLFEGACASMLELTADHLPADVRRFFIERDVAGIIATVSGFAYPVVARYGADVEAELATDEQALAPLLALVPLPNVAFGRAHTRLHFPRAMLDEPLPQADPHTLALCLAQCEVLMQRNEERRGLTAVVRSALFQDSGAFPSLSEVAAELDMHPRTLRRQLADEGTSFRDLLNETRSTLAVDLLTTVGLTVDEVSKRLGYTDTSTFCHAFRRWYGTTPSAYAARWAGSGPVVSRRTGRTPTDTAAG